jgi:hypothetical protein
MLRYARMPAGRFREWLLVVLAAAVLTAIFTWPLASAPGRYGRTNSGDGQWSLWVVSWVAHALTTSPSRLYHANIFHPHDNALAFSEPNIGAGVLAVPVWLATRNPFAAHNSVLFAAFITSFVAAYALARRLTGHTGAAAFCAIAYAFYPFGFAHFPHIQLLLTGGIPLSLVALHRLVDRPAASRAVALGLALFAQGISCAYHGIAAGLTVGFGVLFFAATRRLWPNPRYWGAVALAAAVALGLVTPFLLPSLNVQQDADFRRSLEESVRYSADWRSWLVSAAWAHRWALPYLREWKDVLFPGLLPLCLAVAGVAFAFGRHSSAGGVAAPAAGDSSPRRDTVVFYASLTGLAFWLSFGPKAGLYSALFYTVPIFSFLRAPARFGVLAALGLAVLASFAVAHLARRGSPRRGAAIAGALCLLVAAELFRAPVPVPEQTQPVNAAYRLLASLPRGPVAEFPFFYRSIDFHRHAYYMLASTWHWQPLVNGYSDFIPQDFRDDVLNLAGFPSRDAFAALERRGVRYVTVHLYFYQQSTWPGLLERLDGYRASLRPLTREGDLLLFEIVNWPR